MSTHLSTHSPHFLLRILLSLCPLFSLCFSLCFSSWVMAAEPVKAIKVVYHVADGVEQAARAMVNVRNHLQAEPTTKIVVVALANGVDFLIEGATVKSSGKPFEPTVAALASQGVEFRVCNNTLQGRDISPNKLLLEAKMVPSGVAEIARLQAKEGYVYLRP